jgi:hypothetical protein
MLLLRTVFYSDWWFVRETSIWIEQWGLCHDKADVNKTSLQYFLL